MNLGKENELLEFKKSTSEMEEAMVDISAILNKTGHGVLYFGVKNSGDVIGFQIGESTERDVSRSIFEKIKPQIFPEISKVEIDGKEVIKVSFDGIQKPYSADGRYYKRTADESREMTAQELAQMIMEANYKSYEKQPSDSSLDDVDEDSLRDFLKRSIDSGRLPSMEYDKKAVLEKMSLLSPDGKSLNNAGKLLFSKKEPIELKMAVFATNEKRTFIDMSLVKGNIFSLIKEAEKYISKNMHWGVEIKGFDRIDVPEIPVEAIREIVVNSFAHADYLGWSKNEIDIYPNRIAIYNPGVFPDGYSPEDFVKKDISSKLRNELVCNTLFKCKVVEAWGTGFKKAYDLCEKRGLKVGYEKENDGFWFFFYRQGDSRSAKDVESKKLSETEQAVLNAIKEKPELTREDLTKRTGRSMRTIQRALDSLRESGLIERVGSDRSGSWKTK